MATLTPNIAALLRSDLASFILKCFTTLHPAVELPANWYFSYLAHELRECQLGNRRRMTIAMPPRYGKTTIVSIAFPAWCLGHTPSLRFVCASYSQDLASRISADFRKVVESDWYAEVFPQMRLNPQKCSERDIQTLANGGRFATSVGGPLTGIGGDVLILDDLLKADQAKSEVARQTAMDWFQNTAMSRLDNKTTGSVIVVAQRLHLLDPIGQLHAKGNWHEVVLPAIAGETKAYPLAHYKGTLEHIRHVGDVLDPVREPQETLDRTKCEMGVANFNAQYQQRPEEDGDAYVRWEWFPQYTQLPEFDFLFLSVDPAIATNSTSDYSAIIVIGVLENRNYIVHIERKRIGFELLVERLNALASSYRADSILIERSGIGISLIDHLTKQQQHAIQWIAPKENKETRLLKVLPQIETGAMSIPAAAPWLDVFRSELQAFPNGLHDDQVDALSQFLSYRARLITGVSKPRHRVGRPPQG
jgi:predicted phage terminase large subunit-like protein